MGQLISTASNSTYNEFDTKIPELDQTANIVEAFKLYHYGIDNYEGGSSPANNSMHGHLQDHETRISQVEANPPGINGLLLMGA